MKKPERERRRKVTNPKKSNSTFSGHLLHLRRVVGGAVGGRVAAGRGGGGGRRP